MANTLSPRSLPRLMGRALPGAGTTALFPRGCVTAPLFLAAAVLERSHSPSWAGLETRQKWVIVLFSGFGALAIGLCVNWLIRCPARRHTGGTRMPVRASAVALSLAAQAALIVAAWTYWPFAWQFRLCQEMATELATGAPAGRCAPALNLGAGTFAIPVETEVGPCFCTHWTNTTFVGILYHPGGTPPCDAWAHFAVQPDGVPRRMLIVTCAALSSEWYAVTWKWSE
jgi:hypothetical protein